MTSYFLKFSALGIPAIVALLWWKRAGASSRGFYILSWTNVICYVLWLTHVTLLNRTGGAFLVGLVVGVPLVAAALSLVLVVWVRSVDKSERWMMLTSNLIMLVLWATSMIAPN